MLCPKGRVGSSPTTGTTIITVVDPRRPAQEAENGHTTGTQNTATAKNSSTNGAPNFR